MRRLLGLKDLIIDAVDQVSGVVETTRRSSARRAFSAMRAIDPLAPHADRIEAIDDIATAGIFASIRGVNHAVGAALDLGFAVAGALRAEQPRVSTPAAEAPGPSELRDAALGLVNGVLGDYLEARDNGLRIAMSLRHEGRPLELTADALARALPSATPRVCVFIHGLATTDRSWSMFSGDSYGAPDISYGSLLRDELGMTPIYARYNTGRHISANGRELAALLEELVAAYPGPLAELVLIGHSMGGLVARSACHYGQEEGQRWVAALRRVICLGSPHLGAPLEKAGGLLSRTLRRFDAAAAQIPAQILDARSVGIKDLRYGLVADDEWRGRRDAELRDEHRKPRPLVDHATLHHVAAALTEDPAHPLSALLGDSLVRIPSASGRHRVRARSLPFEPRHGLVVGGVSHLRLVNHPRVYAQIRRWCAGDSEQPVVSAPRGLRASPR